MNKSELVSAVIKAQEGQGLKLAKGQVEKVVSSVLETIRDEVKNGGQVHLIGFGTFKKEHREARKGRNPATGKEITIEAKDVAKFKVSSGFLD